MNAAVLVRRSRHRSRLTLRALAPRAGTSHSTLAAYETGHKVPGVDTLDRIVRSAGFAAQVELVPLVADDEARSRELLAVLDLAAEFPARHSRRLEAPVFGR